MKSFVINNVIIPASSILLINISKPNDKFEEWEIVLHSSRTFKLQPSEGSHTKDRDKLLIQQLKEYFELTTTISTTQVTNK